MQGFSQEGIFILPLKEQHLTLKSLGLGKAFQAEKQHEQGPGSWEGKDLGVRGSVCWHKRSVMGSRRERGDWETRAGALGS